MGRGLGLQNMLIHEHVLLGKIKINARAHTHTHTHTHTASIISGGPCWTVMYLRLCGVRWTMSSTSPAINSVGKTAQPDTHTHTHTHSQWVSMFNGDFPST